MAKTTTGSSSAQYTRSYGDLRGVDFSSDPAQVNAARPTYLINMYRDYDSEHGAAIETIPGYRRLFHFGGKIHGIWGYASSQDEVAARYVVVHAGTKLFTFPFEERDSGIYEERFAGLCDCDSCAFLQNNNFYICDGAGIYVMKADLSVASISEDAYVPITYLHGAPYEQRNMICDRFINRDTVVVSGQYGEAEHISFDNSDEAPSLYTQIEDFLEANYYVYERVLEKNTANHVIYHYCVKEIKSNNGDELDLSLFAKTYTNSYYHKNPVTGSNDLYKQEYVITVSANLLEQGRYKRIITNDTLSEEEIQALKDIGVEEIYSGGTFPMKDMYLCDVMIYDPCVSLQSVKLLGEEIPEYKDAVADGGEAPDVFYMPVREKVQENGEDKWYVSYIHLYAKDKFAIDAKEIEIAGVADKVQMKRAGDIAAPAHTDYMGANTEYDGTSEEAIFGCRIATTFDGRVFLTGNPKLPNTVFYSCRDLTGYNNPAYFGVYNYFNDGEGNDANVALLSTSGVLMVLKKNTLQGSSIFYHVGADGIDDVVPRIYPSTPGVAGLGCEGAALNFLDDAVFLSERGLEGLSKEQLNLERTIGHRSSNVDRLLRECELADARMCRWGGYLCLFDGTGKVFLGDSRQRFQGLDGALEYEWYYLEGIGDHEGDVNRFRTLSQFPIIRTEAFPDGESLDGATVLGEPLAVDAQPCDVAFEDLYTGEAALTVDGEVHTVSVKYVERDGVKILCDCDGELVGGDFSPSCLGFSMDGVLFFGTAGGAVCCFNTDKRGAAVDGEAVASDTIHRSFYSFAGHRYVSGLALKSDNCGVPHLTKRTARKTCVMKLKTMRGASVSVRIRTDREPWHEVLTSFAGTDFSFSDMEFDNFSFLSESDTIVTVKDKEKKWVEKQFYLYSDGWRRPFGLHSLTFNYEIQGRVKKG